MAQVQPGDGAAVVETERDGGVAVIRLNRPECLNAVNAALVDGLVAAFDTVTADGAGAVVLTGRGRAFCAGHDLRTPREDAATLRARVDRIQDVTRRIRACPVPVVAAVHGHAIGAGAEFALGCDLVVAADDARFRFPEVELGLSVTGGVTTLLPLIVGPLKAKELVMLGATVGATDAERLGLVNTVVPAAGLLPAALDWAARLAALPRTPLAYAKRALDAGTDAAVEAALALETEHAISTETPPDGPASIAAGRAHDEG